MAHTRSSEALWHAHWSPTRTHGGVPTISMRRHLDMIGAAAPAVLPQPAMALTSTYGGTPPQSPARRGSSHGTPATAAASSVVSGATRREPLGLTSPPRRTAGAVGIVGEMTTTAAAAAQQQPPIVRRSDPWTSTRTFTTCGLTFHSHYDAERYRDKVMMAGGGGGGGGGGHTASATASPARRHADAKWMSRAAQLERSMGEEAAAETAGAGAGSHALLASCDTSHAIPLFVAYPLPEPPSLPRQSLAPPSPPAVAITTIDVDGGGLTVTATKAVPRAGAATPTRRPGGVAAASPRDAGAGVGVIRAPPPPAAANHGGVAHTPGAAALLAYFEAHHHAGAGAAAPEPPPSPPAAADAIAITPDAGANSDIDADVESLPPARRDSTTEGLQATIATLLNTLAAQEASAAAEVAARDAALADMRRQMDAVAAALPALVLGAVQQPLAVGV